MRSSILDASIAVLRLRPKWVEVLESELDVHTLEDLLFYTPFRYNDRSQIIRYAEIRNAETPVQLSATLIHISYVGEGTKKRLEARFQDESGTFIATFFKGQQYIYKQLHIGLRYVIFGKPNQFRHTFSFVHPEIEALSEERTPNLGFEAIYEIPESLKKVHLHSKQLNNIQATCLHFVDGKVEELLPTAVLAQYNLMSRNEAFIRLHFPRNEKEAVRARERFKYEEWFLLQLEQAEFIVREASVKGIVCRQVGNLFNGFYKEHLAFALTEAQKRVLRDIHADMKSGRQMNRLLQGDVGSGKTLVALFSLLLAADNHLQGCLMAPTEILATQHYKSISRMLGEMPVRVALLTGSTSTKERREIHRGLEDGSIQIIVGTHALIEDSVTFFNLGLVIVDEQHRFGVAQRAKLWSKNPEIMPHILVMSATPIPRTLALTLYAGLDISIIDELPAGRKPIATYIVREDQRIRLYKKLREEIDNGHQVYFVFPLVNESEALDLQSATEGFVHLQNMFPQYKIGLLHGQMPTDEKEVVMRLFASGELNILVATTVIEVGVDVPNATIIVIEEAQRFGLTQLHQLRGRVGRGASKSYCFLMTRYDIHAHTLARLKVMEATNDGFRIAEEDLRLRGYGELNGLQQSGKSTGLLFGKVAEDAEIIQKMREAVRTLYSQNPTLVGDEYQLLRERIQRRKARRDPNIVKVG
ncbi:MAG: ATP-dependent DNA helicase RecG [Bacteroides sp.]